ncbi:MAG: hypothetical protein KC586_11470, partial [Myxococcales bacterium]|nr:hypothetical protein [Myxococcales bacterium]
MSAAKKAAAGARSIGILLGIWGVLALVAWIAGVLPARDGEVEPEPTEPTLSDVDGGVAQASPEDAGVGTPVAAEPADAG